MGQEISIKMYCKLMNTVTECVMFHSLSNGIADKVHNIMS